MVGRMLPALLLCLKVMSIWPLRAAILCLCFFSVLENKSKNVVLEKVVDLIYKSYLAIMKKSILSLVMLLFSHPFSS